MATIPRTYTKTLKLLENLNNIANVPLIIMENDNIYLDDNLLLKYIYNKFPKTLPIP